MGLLGWRGKHGFMFLIAFSLGQQLSSQARKRIKGLFVGLKTFFGVFPSLPEED
jgi:hypothetical protein